MKNPWKGLDFYRESEILYGRDAEIDSLYDYIKHNSQVVLYGRSGIGKSSIINAGIFPEARRDGMLPLAVKLTHDNSSSYVQQLKDVIRHKGIDAYEVVPALREDESLWEFFHRHQFFDGEGNRVRLLVVFDQFEEIFTLQNNEGVRQSFFAELADLFNDTIPEYIVEARKVVSESVKKADAPAVEVTENELNIDLNLEIDEEKEDARDYLASSSAHIVFVIREDFLSYLERYTVHIPVMRNNRFSLLPLNEEQAMDVILKPCPGLVDEEVARLIIKAVTQQQNYVVADGVSIEVDAAVLSLFLSELFARKAVGDEHITAEMVTTLGQNIISDYYEKSVCDIPAHLIDILEEHLLTVEGRRDNRSKSSLIVAGLDEATIDSLVNEKKILRQFYYEGDLRIEFIHDILCPVILARRERREQRLHLSQLEAQKEAARQEEKNWIITRWASIMVGVICIVFGIFVAVKWDEVSKHEKRMNQLEQSLIVQVAKQKLNDRDIYGAMQLLVNVIDTTHYDRVDAQTAQYECLLRQALDSLNNSAYKCVARRSVGWNRHLYSISKDERWVAYQSPDGNLRICDAKTLNEVHVFHSRYPANLVVTDFSEKPGWIGETDCLVLQDDSVLLLCGFGISLDDEKTGVLYTFGRDNQKIFDASFLHHDSLIVVRLSSGIEVWDFSKLNLFVPSELPTVFSMPESEYGKCVDYALSPNQRWLLIQQGKYIYLYDTYSWTLNWKYQIEDDTAEDMEYAPYLKFSKDGKYVVCRQFVVSNAQPKENFLCFSTFRSDSVCPIIVRSGIFGEDDSYYYITYSGKDGDLNENSECCVRVNLCMGEKTIVAQNIPTMCHAVSMKDDSLIILLGKGFSVYQLNMHHALVDSLSKLAASDAIGALYYNSTGDVLSFADFSQTIQVCNFSGIINPLLPKSNMTLLPNDTLPQLTYDVARNLTKDWPDLFRSFLFECTLNEDSSQMFFYNYRNDCIEGRYLDNGAVFMLSPVRVKGFCKSTHYLSGKNQIYVETSNDDVFVVDVLPLPELVDSCKRVLGPYWQYKTKEEMYRYLK